MADMQSYPWATAWKSCWTLNGGRTGLGTAGFPHVSLFFHTSSSLLSSSVFLFLSASLSYSLPGSFPSASFLHAASLNLFLSSRFCLFFRSSFLLCAALLYFLSLSANSRCLIHQHLLKLWAVLCTSVAWCMREAVCVRVHEQESWEKVCEIMCMHVTVSSSHLWHAASPHASIRKQHRWQNLRCHGGGNRSSETNSNTLQRDTLPDSMWISGPSISSQV